MEPKNKNNVINIGQNDRDALAKEVGMTEFVPSSVPAESEHSTETPRTGRLLTALGMTAAVAGTAWLAAPRAHDTPQPDNNKSFAEKVADSAKVSGNPAEDFVVNGIRVKTNDPNRNTPSEAVLNDPRVKAYEKANPDEVSSITDSAMALPGGKEFGIAMRDVDHDGDKDAIAVEIKK